MLKVNAYTTGLNAPSARYRVRQLIPYLKMMDVNVNEIFSNAGTFPPSDRSKHLLWAMKNVSENFVKVFSQPQCDVTWLQKAMLSKHFTFERFLKKPLVFDVDDAIFLDNNGAFTQKIAYRSQRVICGNSFLADYFSKYNENIDIIPTAVDVSKYDDASDLKENMNIFYLLWTGTSSGYQFIYKIEKALKRIVDKYDFVKIKIISDSPPKFKFLKENDFLFQKWSQEIEFSSIKSSDLGIMPINDDDQSRGKCSYKMLCYMAAKLPVVVSPFGMNKEVLGLGELGYGAVHEDEWFYALDEVISSLEIRNRLSSNAYRIVKEYFDISVIAGMITDSFKKIS